MSSDRSGHMSSTPPSWNPSSVELPSAQPPRGPSRPVSARAGTARQSASQRPVSAGTSLVLQSRQSEVRKSSDQHLQAAGHAFQNSMGELFEGFCAKLRRDLSADVALAIGEIHAAVAGRWELEQMAADIKAEVKTEAAVLRQKLIQSVHQLSGEIRSLKQAPCGRDAGVAGPDAAELGALGEGLAELRAAVQAVGPELAAVRSAVGELQAGQQRSAEPPADSDFDLLLEEVRSLRAHVDSSLAAGAQTSRSLVPQGAAADAAAGADAVVGINRHGPLEDGGPYHDLIGPTLAARHTRDAGLTMLLDEVRDFRSKHDADIYEVVRASKEVRATVYRELKEMQTQHEVDLGNVVSAVKGTGRNCPVDFSPLLAEIRQLHPTVHAEVSMAVENLKAENAQLQRAMDDVKRQIDFTEVLYAVRAHKPEVDFSPVLQAINDSRQALEHLPSIKEIKHALSEIKEGQQAADLSGVVKELRQMQVSVDTGTSAILQTLRDGSQVVNFSAVLQAMETNTMEVKSELLKAVREQRQQPALDLTPVLREVRDCRTVLDCSQGLAEIKHALRELKTGQLQADTAPFAAELRHLQSRVDACGSAVKALAEGGPAASRSEVVAATEAIKTEVLQAVHKLEGQMDFAALLKALEAQKADADLSPVLKEIVRELHEAASRQPGQDPSLVASELQQMKAHLESGLSAILKTMTEGGILVDFSSLLQSVEAVRREVDLSGVLRAVDSLSQQVDFSEVVKVAQEIKQDLQEVVQDHRGLEHHPVMAEVREIKSECVNAFATLLTALQQGNLSVDLLPLLSGMESAKREVLAAIGERREDAASRTTDDFARSMQEIRADVHRITEEKVRTGLASVLTELRQMRTGLDVSHSIEAIRKDVREVRDGKVGLDLPGVLRELQRTHSNVDAGLSEVLKTLNSGVQADLSAIIPAIEAFKIEVDLSEVLAAVNSLRGQFDLSEVLNAVRLQPRPEVDLAPVLKAIDDSRSAPDVAQSVQELRKEFQEARRGGLGADLTVALRDVQQMHSQVDARLHSVLATLNGGKITVDSSEVLAAIDGMRAEVDARLHSVLATLSGGKITVDSSEVLAAIDGMRAEVDARQHSVLATVNGGKITVDSSEVLAAIDGMRAEVGAATGGVARGVEELRQAERESQDARLRIDLPLLASEVQQLHACLASMRSAQVDLANVVGEVRELRSLMESTTAAVVKAMQEGALAVDLSPLLKQLADTRQEVAVATGGVSQGLCEIRHVAGEVRDLRIGADMSLLASEVRQIQARVEGGMSAVLRSADESKMAGECSTDMLVKAVDATRAEVIRAVRDQRGDFGPILKALGDANGGQADLARLVGEVLYMLGEMREGLFHVHCEPPPVPEALRQQLRRVEMSLSALQSSIASAGMQRHAELEDAEKLQAQRYYAQWQNCGAEGYGDPWLADAGQQGGYQDLHRRPASAPPRSSPWRLEADRRHEEPDDDPDLALAESLAVRAQHLADAAAVAQCRAEAIEASEASQELPTEASVLSMGTEPWLAPIPEEPDPEASMHSPVDQVLHFYPPLLDDLDLVKP